MLDELDYKEPECALCGGREFYNPQEDDPKGTVPVERIITKVDQCYEKGDLNEALRLLNYWRQEAVSLRDLRGQISINNELVGVYRKLGDGQNALKIVDETMGLVDRLKLGETVSGATIILNCATDLKAFGEAKRALPMYAKVEEIYTTHLDGDDDMLAGLYNNYALALADVEEYAKAEDYYRKALGVKAKIKEGELESAITYINLAHLYESWGKTERIGEVITKADEMLKTPGLTHNGYYAFVLEKCAPSFDYFGYTAEAEYYNRLVGEIYART